jgi:hypothetical protein
MNHACVRIGLFGTNDHQLSFHLPEQARVVAVADYDRDVPEGIRVYDDLAGLLDDRDRSDLIVLGTACGTSAASNPVPRSGQARVGRKAVRV